MIAVSTQTSFAARKAAQAQPRPRYTEHALLFVALMATTVFPAIAKYQAADAPMESPVAQVVWSVLYCAAALRLVSLRRVLAPLFRGSAILCAFIGLMFASILWSVAPAVTFANSIELIGTTLIGYYIVARYTLVEFLSVLAVTFGTIALACFAMIFGAPAHGRMDWGTGAWSGIFQEKNNLGAAMSLAIISLGLLVAQPNVKRRPAIFVVLLACVALLIGTNSITALADCIFAGLVASAALLCRSPRLGALARVSVIFGVALAAAAVMLLGINVDSVTAFLGRSATLTGRTDFWPYIERAIQEGPFYGYGYNAFFRSPVGAGYLSYYVVDAGGWTPYHAHNSFLQICLDAGYPGVAMLVFMILAGFWKSIGYAATSASRVSVWPMTIIAYLLFGSFTETYFGDYNTFEWIFFVAALLYPLRSGRRAPPMRPRHAFARPTDRGGVPPMTPKHAHDWIPR